MLSYNWNIKDTKFTKDKGTVLSCFSCGGGSTMGYKLAGFDVLGCNEIDPRMMNVYIENHKPKYNFLESIVSFKERDDLPDELYNLDILDGSPPCSSFSLAGNRSKDWGKKKKFKEGQKEQVLDTLFFDFIDLAKKLQPKVVVSENVKGLLMGKAKEYVKKIYSEFDKAGYYVNHYVLDSSKMGVPQKRERVFFICIRKDLATKGMLFSDLFKTYSKVDLKFNEKEIQFHEIQEDIGFSKREPLRKSYLKHWENTNSKGYSFKTKNKTKFGFFYKAIKNKVLCTITSGVALSISEAPLLLTKKELCLAGSFPLDFNFLDEKPQYIIGMSVPPLMIYGIAEQIQKQILSKIK